MAVKVLKHQRSVVNSQ